MSESSEPMGADFGNLNIISDLFTRAELFNSAESLRAIILGLSPDTDYSICEKCMIVLNDIRIRRKVFDSYLNNEKELWFYDNYNDILNTYLNTGETTLYKGNDERILDFFSTVKKTLFAFNDQTIINNKDDIKDLSLNIIFKKISQQRFEEDINIHNIIFVAKEFVHNEISKYKLWESSICNFVKPSDFYLAIDYLGNFELLMENVSSNDKQLVILSIFIIYYYTISDSEHWKDFCFLHGLSDFCNSPQDILFLTLLLQVHEYGIEFRNEYEKYLNETNNKPLFDVKAIKLTPNNDNEHDDCFEKIHKTKICGGTDDALYEAVKNLYSKVVEDKYIDNNTPLTVFMYRFTGFLPYQSKNIKIKWITNNNILAYIIQCLYTVKEGENITKPKYKKLSTYFLPEMSNGSALSDRLERRKKMEVREMLGKCGFINVDPSKMK